MTMNNNSEVRLKEQKKKIFAQQVNQSRNSKNMGRSSLANLLGPAQDLSSPTNSHDLALKMDELKIKNNELKLLLKEERQRYDSLFQEYQQLMQKNSLIEKQYINLKYQHNKEIKDFKRYITVKIKQEVEKYNEQFYYGLKSDNIGDIAKGKIQRLMEQLKGLSHVIASLKFSRQNKKNSQYSRQQSQTDRSSISDRHGIEDIQFLEIGEIQQEKQVVVLKEQQVITSPRQSEKYMFEDQYYGTLDDFKQFEEKVTMRRNYQLMSRNNRSSTDVRRKKIFKSVVQN